MLYGVDYKNHLQSNLKGLHFWFSYLAHRKLQSLVYNCIQNRETVEWKLKKCWD